MGGARHLKLENFRRHASTELAFDGDSQLVLISGENGTGKSSLLEAFTWACYGESRRGKRNLDDMLRWGHELEGMQVEFEFVVGNTTYRVVRRRDNGATSAQLYANDHLIVQGSDEVTREITKVFGMDAVGFRLAVIAQQDQLDGLASLKPTERAETVSRLLRVDVVGRAADEARKMMRTQREVVAHLRTGDDVDALTAARDGALAELTAARAALDESRAAAVTLDAELAASESLEAAWMAATNAVSLATGLLTGARAEHDRLTAELADLHIPVEVHAPAQTLEELAVEVTGVERALARGEAAQALRAQRAAVTRELDTVTARLTLVEQTLGADGGQDAAHAAVAALSARTGELAEQITAAEATYTAARERWSAANAGVAALGARLADSQTLGATCERCGQDIPDEHKHTQLAELREQLARATAAKAAAEQAGAEARDQLAALRAQLAQGEADLAAARARVEALAGTVREHAELSRRASTYRDQLERLVVEDVDLDALYARKAELAVAVTMARQAAEQAQLRQVLLARQGELTRSVAAAAERIAAAQAQIEAARPDADLTAAWTRRQQLKEDRVAERETTAECSKLVAVTEQALSHAEQLLARSVAARARIAEHERRAMVASRAAEVLTEAEKRLAQAIRPALEGKLCELLDRLSAGRYTQAKVSANYAVSVSSDGKFRPLEQFSGGEQKLIALAMRLALAEIVSARHGAGGAGFLILDEVFGSQDAGRRETIVEGLRNLRDLYGQIFLISHVGGMEDDADDVITISPDGEERAALVSR